MFWLDLGYRVAVYDRLCRAAFLEGSIGSDYMALLLGRRVEIAWIWFYYLIK